MVRFKNAATGGDMWVHESRVEEYKAAGHRPAAESVSNSNTDAPAAEADAAPKKKPTMNKAEG